jgi:hypothetical protein
MNPLAQVNPKIFIVEHAEIFAGPLEQLEAIIVKGGGMNLFAEKRAHSITHLPRSSHGIGEREHLLRLRVLLLDKAGSTVDEDRSFSRTGARDHQHGAVNVVDRFALAIIGNKWSRL